MKYKDQPNLKTAIGNAFSKNKHRALVFSSTADEGAYSGPVWPAEYDGVLSVSATDEWGHLPPRAEGVKRVDIQIPGHNIEADGPTYMKSQENTVSGSSVATALAAGIVSLALTKLQTFNHDLNSEELKFMRTKECMGKVFKKMGADKSGIQFSNLFPAPSIADGNPDERLSRRLEMSEQKWHKDHGEFWNAQEDRFQEENATGTW